MFFKKISTAKALTTPNLVLSATLNLTRTSALTIFKTDSPPNQNSAKGMIPSIGSKIYFANRGTNF
jgi:hypothetical protein